MLAVNLITGFLGTGKTTLLRRLLLDHPPEQTWAVLINEVGEVGLDGELLDQPDIRIEQVAGGCLCCVAAPLFEVGLNRLIRQARPQRILIEASGLAHPAQVLSSLRFPIYREVLEVQATVCVMDARHLNSPAHREHPNFIDQIHLSDILIANKADHYGEDDEKALLQLAAGMVPPKQHVHITEQGRMPWHWLASGAPLREAQFPEAHAFLLAQQSQDAESQSSPERSAWLNFSGSGDGYQRAGWIVGTQFNFSQQRLLQWLDDLPATRAKGIFRCQGGCFSYNRAEQDRQWQPHSGSPASRLQLIAKELPTLDELDTDLRACLQSG